MTASITRALLAGGLVLVASCGDPLLDDGYRGEPLFSLGGKVASTGEQPDYDAPLRAGVFWLPYDPTTLGAAFAERTPIERLDRIEGVPEGAGLVEQGAVSLDVRFPGTFEINVFAPPPPAAKLGDGPLRYGVVLLYEDRDGDGHLGADERIGGATGQLVVYSDRPLAADAPDNPLDRAVQPGYLEVTLPLRCGAPPPAYEVDETYGARVGAACATETEAADCGPEGTCLLEDYDGPLPGGYCVLDDGAIPRDVDPPRTMRLVETERDGRELEAYYRRCGHTADCRVGYTCQGHVCLPALAPALVLDPTAEVEGTCAEYHEVERREVGG